MNEQHEPMRWARTILQVPETADLVALRSAFRKRSMETHPDQGGSADAFAEVARAYQTLSAHLAPTEDIELSDDGSMDLDPADGNDVPAPHADGWVVDSDEVDVRVVDEDALPRRRRFEDMFLDALRREYRDE